MAIRECIIADKRPELNEEAVADLRECLRMHEERCADLELKMHKSAERIRLQKRAIAREKTQAGKKRELQRCRVHLDEHRRMQADVDKSNSMQYTLRLQIESIVTTHMDAMVIDAMQTYSMTACRLGLPQKAKEIEGLAQDLQSRSDEISCLNSAMEDALGGFAPPSTMDDDELMLEIDSFAMSDEDEDIEILGADESPVFLPAVPQQPRRDIQNSTVSTRYVVPSST